MSTDQINPIDHTIASQKDVNEELKKALDNIDQENEVIYAKDSIDRLSWCNLTDEFKQAILNQARAQATHRIVNNMKTALEAKITECMNNNLSSDAIDATAQLQTVTLMADRLAPIPVIPEEMAQDALKIARNQLSNVQMEVINNRPKQIKNVLFLRNDPWAVQMSTHEERKARNACDDFDRKVSQWGDEIFGWEQQRGGDAFTHLLMGAGIAARKSQLLQHADEVNQLVASADESCRHPRYANNK